MSSKVVKLTKAAAAYKCSAKEVEDVLAIIALHSSGAELSEAAVAALVKFAKWQVIKTTALSKLISEDVDADEPQSQPDGSLEKFVKSPDGFPGPVGSPFSVGHGVNAQIFSMDGKQPPKEYIESFKSGVQEALAKLFGGAFLPKTNPLFEPSEDAASEFQPNSKMEIYEENGKKKYKINYRRKSGDGFTEHSVTYQTGEEAFAKTNELLKDASVIPWVD